MVTYFRAMAQIKRMVFSVAYIIFSTDYLLRNEANVVTFLPETGLLD